jgi:hypothetical protein|tara:strand:+ start:1378 stop:1536 length:159 start_codon:yes stop_codon:yes gene_type:complete
MVIKKAINFISNFKKKSLGYESRVIIGVKSKSTSIGRQKVVSLKKIGKKKRG